MSESSDEQAAGQHFLVCGTEDCQKNGKFYCNACHRLCVKNAETNIWKIQTPNPMKLCLTDTANNGFLWRNASTTPHEI